MNPDWPAGSLMAGERRPLQSDSGGGGGVGANNNNELKRQWKSARPKQVAGGVGVQFAAALPM